MIKGSLSGAEDHRGSDFPGKAGIGKTPSMSKDKGKKFIDVVVGEPLKKSLAISHYE